MTIRQRQLQKATNILLVLSLVLGLFPPRSFTPIAAAAPLSQGDSRAPNSSNQPDVLATPISIARTQSSHTSNSASTISYFVTNNLPPTLLPDVTSGATTTDTIDILAGFVLTEDMNTLRNVMLETTVINGSISDVGSGVQSGSDIDWVIGDLLPGQTTIVSMTVQTPATAADFVDLDDGAEVSAEQYNIPIIASARPANIIPDSVSTSYLDATIDADSNDEDMLWVSAEFSQGPTAAFNYVQSFDYDAYAGSLRGTRATIWGAAGNSIDQSSALIAMLRGAGIPARYRHGTLSTTNAQTLLNSMFDMNAFEGVAGYIPSGTATSDPLNDADLLAIAQDHWWVEAYLPGSGWTDLDPTFPNAAIGDSFEASVASDGTDRIAELPANLRPQLEISLRVESYQTFPVAGSNIIESRPLSLTVSLPEIAAKEIILGHFVDSDSQGGLAFSSVTHTYTPYFVIDDYTLYAEGEPYQDLLTSFPLATHFTIAQFIEYKLTDLDGTVTTFERSAKDLLGPDVRVGGGNPDLSPPAGDGALVSGLDQFTTWIMPNSVDRWVDTRRRAQSVSQMVRTAILVADALDINVDDPTPEEEDLFRRTLSEAQVTSSSLLANGGVSFAANADHAMNERETALLVSQYFSSPRIFSLSSSFNPLTEEDLLTVDLRKTDATTIAYPGQAVSAEKTANWTKGLTESRLEGEALDAIADAPTPALTTYRLFEEMALQGIEPMLLDASDIGLLGSFDLSPAQYFYAAAALNEGKTIVIPSAGVQWEGEARLAFWEVDPATGETIGVGEDGLHSAAVQYVNQTKLIFKMTKPAIKRMAKEVEKLYKYIAAEITAAIGRRAVLPQDDWHYLADAACPIEACGIEQFFTAISNEPIELPEMLFTYVAPVNGNPLSASEVAVAAGGAFDLVANPATSSIDVGEAVSFSAEISNPTADTFLTAAYGPDGWTITIDSSGAVAATHPVGIAPGSYEILVVTQSASDRATVGSVIHTVTVNADDNLDVIISAEPNLTINVNDAQLTDAAYTVDLHNLSTNPHTFNINITGIAEAELILNGVAGDATTQVTLQPGELRKVGLYYNPPTLPAPAASFTPNAGVSMDSPALTDSDSESGSVPTLPYPKLNLPEVIYAAASDTVNFDLTVNNVGNASGSFALSSSVPLSWTLNNLSSPSVVASGAADTHTVELVTDGGITGVRYPVFVSAEINSTRITAQTEVIIISPETEALFTAADDLASCSADPILAGYFSTVANAVSLLEGACNGGNCNTQQRDAVANSSSALISAINLDFNGVSTTALSDAAGTLASASTVQENLDALPPLSSAVADLVPAVCAIAQSRPELSWEPVYQAALTGSTVTPTLTLENVGTLTSTYTLSTSFGLGVATETPTLAPGESVTYDHPSGSISPVLVEWSAEVTADASPLSSDSASAYINWVDRFIQLTSVMPTPNFVETGVSESTINVEIANFANLPIEATAVVDLVGDSGVLDSAETTITIRPGNPQTYALTTFNTSAFDSGIYTVTVNLVDSNDDPIDDGSGYNFLGVGQALGAVHYVVPELVAPGTVTVTSIISTEILVETATPSDSGGSSRALWEATGQRVANEAAAELEETDQQSIANDQLSIEGEEVAIATTSPISEADSTSFPIPNSQFSVPHSRAAQALTNYTRTESADAAISYDSFSSRGIIGATENATHRSNTLGATATYTFTGPWVNVGLLGISDGGMAEIFIDGVSQGTVDTFAKQTRSHDHIYDGLSNAAHTISVTVLATSNPLSTNEYIYLDFIDVWDGTPLAQGTFEDGDDGFFYTNAFGNRNDTDASDGHYQRGLNGTAWLAFSGTGVDLDVFKYNGAGPVDIYLDGQYQFRVDLYAPSDITETITIDGLADTLHLLTMRSRLDYTTVDKAVVPAVGTAYVPPVQTGIVRLEEMDPSLLYNGQPFTGTVSSWGQAASNAASRGDTANTTTAGDTISFSFDGDWVGVSFFGRNDSGQIELFVDGLSQGSFDLYRRAETPIGIYLDGFGAGSHTVSITVLAINNPLSSDNDVYFDFYEYWDGSAETAGSFSADLSDLDRLRFSNNWGVANDGNATDGSYIRNTTGGSSWFHFTGSSATYEAFAYNGGGQTEVYLDGVLQTTLDLYSIDDMTQTLSFDGLADAPHVIQVTQFTDAATVDRFHAPAIDAGFVQSSCSGYCRYEETDSGLRFNGQPLNIAASTWSEQWFPRASGDYTQRSSTANDSASFDFTGEWVNLGLIGDRFGGNAEIYIDGALVDTVDTYRRSERAIDLVYPLSAGAHTISVTVLGTSHPNSLNDYVAIDFVDTWDGSALANGSFEETDPRIMTSNSFYYQADTDASGGQFYEDGLSNTGTIWFPFEGDSITLEGMQRSSGSINSRVWVDGVLVAEPNQHGAAIEQRDFSFDGFGAGIHLLRMDRYRGELLVDGFTVPGSAPFYSTSVITGLVRYEENDPAIVYNGSDSHEQRSNSWTNNGDAQLAASGSYVALSSTISDTIELDFDGSWINIGWFARSGGGSAEIYIDDSLVETVDLNSVTQIITSTQLSVITGTHTVKVRVVGNGSVRLDYIDVYDGGPIGGDYIDADTQQKGGQINFNATPVDYSNANATDGTYAGLALFNNSANIWYTFVGDSASVRYFTRDNTSTFNVYIDGQFVEMIDAYYPFTDQPFNQFYSGLGDGPHVLRVENISTMRIDGFESQIDNPVQVAPSVEWFDNTPGGGPGSFNTPAGMLSGLAVGDINNDGLIEIVAPSDTYAAGGAAAFYNSVFIYRGDGQDAGDGTPIIDRIEFTKGGTGVGRETIGSVALAELDGVAGSEIVVPSDEGMYSLHADGTTHWFTDTFKAYSLYGTPAIGNLDADAEPEIVVNMDKSLVVYEADGSIGWSTTLTSNVGMPLLTDVNGDTVLDIVFFNGDRPLDAPGGPYQLHAYSYNFGAPTLLWSSVITGTMDDLRGSAAVADIDDDGKPEIVVSSNGWVSAFNGEDGSELWTSQLDAGTPGGVSIADIDGAPDGEVEIITGMKYDDGIGVGRLYALNADGSILWERPAYDSTSANTASVLDVNGDGVYEIAWNGAELGFTIFNGADGEILFNEPDLGVLSLTATEYPIFADVDLDGYAEIVVPANKGIRVFGLDGVWGEARPVWNQHSYHITNVNDDLTIPFSEYDSWDVHNTYRTQFPSTIALPSFSINVSHTVGSDNQMVDSFSVTPDLSADPIYQWDYVQTGISKTVTRTIDSVLTTLVAGESRLVSTGTTVSYTLGSGQNSVLLPPLYVNVARLIALQTVEQTVGAGATVIITVTLSNPTDAAASYDLELTAFGKLSALAGTEVPAHGSVDVPITVDVPNDATGSYAFVILVDNGSGGTDSASGLLNVVNAFDMALTPALQPANAAEWVTYTLVITNNLASAESITLLPDSLAEVSAPATVSVSANGTTSAEITARGFLAGQLPIIIEGTAASGAADSASAILDVTSSQQVIVSLASSSLPGGPGMPTVSPVIVTNLGDALATYDLTVTPPAGWQAELAQSEIMLGAGVFNSAEIQLILTPPTNATPGSYSYAVSATAQSATRSFDTPATAAVQGTVILAGAGVVVNIGPDSQTLAPNATGSWDVGVTNTGSTVETFDLAASGAVALSGAFSTPSVTVNPGETQTVTLTASDLSFLIAGDYSFAAAATAQSDSTVIDDASASMIISEAEAVTVAWTPSEQTVGSDEIATYLLVISNTGNIATQYDLTVALASGSGVTLLPASNQVTIPAFSSIHVAVQAVPDGTGVYTLDGSAESVASTGDSAEATLTVTVPTAISSLSSSAQPLSMTLLLGLLFMALATSSTGLRRR